MILRKIRIASFLSLLMMGMSTAMPAVADYTVATIQKVEKEWTLLETKNGVSCYYRMDQMGTGNGVYLRFVNNSGTNVSLNWTVNLSKDNSTTGKLTLTPGQTIDSNTQPELAIRITSGKPTISFTVSK